MLQGQQRQVLEGVAALFADQGRWTSGSDGRDRSGQTIGALNKRAVRWCLQGGVKLIAARVAGLHGEHAALALDVHNHVKKLAQAKGYKSIPDFNDRLGYSHVRDLIKEALGADKINTAVAGIVSKAIAGAQAAGTEEGGITTQDTLELV